MVLLRGERNYDIYGFMFWKKLVSELSTPQGRHSDPHIRRWVTYRNKKNTIVWKQRIYGDSFEK